MLFSLIQKITRPFKKRRRETLTHDEIYAAGNSPPPLSESYAESLHILDSVVRDCVTVSRKHAGIMSPTPKHFYASVLFTSIISRGISLTILAPHSPWAAKMIEHWDYASAAMITRTLIELRVAFHYLCYDTCSEDEWQCRWHLLNLHDRVARKRLMESRSETTNDGALFDSQIEELRAKLSSNPYFLTLRNQKKFLHGQTAYLSPIEEMAERAGMSKETYRFLHIMFSSHVHGLPLSYFRMGEQERGRGVPSPIEESYTEICLSCAASLLAATRDEVEVLFKNLVK